MERLAVVLTSFTALFAAVLFWPWPIRIEPVEIAQGYTYSPRQAEYLGVPWRETFRAATQLGTGLVRLGAYWDEIEAIQGQYDFSRLDTLLKDAEASGARVVLTVGMKAPRWPEYYIPKWLERRLDAPSGSVVSRDPDLQLKTLEFVQRVVWRYADRGSIVAWQVENEPLDPAGPRRWRIGQDLLEREIAAVRRLDPRNRPIVVNLFVHVDPLSFMLPLDERAETILKHADILGLDAYPVIGMRLLGLDFYLNWSGWAWERTLQRYAALAQDYGKRTWITEAQAEPWEPGKVVYKAAGASPSMAPGAASMIASRLHAAGFDTILLWGIEHWYMRKTVHDDPAWWSMGQDLLVGKAE
jgi:hypothetical protein